MLSLDALDLSLSNLIQIIKMRTSAGFIPSYSSGTLKSRDRSNPPVTSNILNHVRISSSSSPHGLVPRTLSSSLSLQRLRKRYA